MGNDLATEVDRLSEDIQTFGEAKRECAATWDMCAIYRSSVTWDRRVHSRLLRSSGPQRSLQLQSVPEGLAPNAAKAGGTTLAVTVRTARREVRAEGGLNGSTSHEVTPATKCLASHEVTPAYF